MVYFEFIGLLSASSGKSNFQFHEYLTSFIRPK